jgi:hypothetical protein
MSPYVLTAILAYTLVGLIVTFALTVRFSRFGLKRIGRGLLWQLPVTVVIWPICGILYIYNCRIANKYKGNDDPKDL